MLWLSKSCTVFLRSLLRVYAVWWNDGKDRSALARSLVLFDGECMWDSVILTGFFFPPSFLLKTSIFKDKSIPNKIKYKGSFYGVKIIFKHFMVFCSLWFILMNVSFQSGFLAVLWLTEFGILFCKLYTQPSDGGGHGDVELCVCVCVWVLGHV